ncbi:MULTISPECIES: CDP-alcohol phosphatidyltransferase family protein [unclassified Clostridium]|uniref:CDP-alcohol phosphatidyltransferase family protein n=1 Tax=unclassified Clostridium TaxID=2614128 RepID=UPI0002976209|nr:MULTISPECIES: CDP-alcohol phosphatidyltransferase family protein [unclassified Clostridium]EKQ57385.1 MAG: phosphatidylglycerophosphate synthase [Clostridium sp. Maddingley MBC34-26]
MKLLVKSLPNIITSTRIVISFLFAYTITQQFIYGQERSLKLIILFLFICISDLLDGRIARKTNSVSVIGAHLDVFADLLYIILSYITLINVKILPVWFLGFICFKFSEFVATSKFMKKKNNLSDNPFVFDKVGRAVSVIFFIIPGVACIYKYFEVNNLGVILNLFLVLVLIAGLYSSYLRIQSCVSLYKISNNINKN